MNRLLRFILAPFAAATLAAEPEPEWDRESLDRLLEAVHQAQDDADWVMWRQEFIDD